MLMSHMFKPFLMSRHCCCDVATLNVDVSLLLRLCSDVTTLSCDVKTDVATLVFSTLPTSADVATFSRCHDEVATLK